MLCGDHLLGVDGYGWGRVLAQLTAQPLYLRDGLGIHLHPAPAPAGELKDGPDERERRGLAGEAADDLGAPADLHERALEQVRGPDSLSVLGREPQMSHQHWEVRFDDGHR